MNADMLSMSEGPPTNYIQPQAATVVQAWPDVEERETLGMKPRSRSLRTSRIRIPAVTLDACLSVWSGPPAARH